MGNFSHIKLSILQTDQKFRKSKPEDSVVVRHSGSPHVIGTDLESANLKTITPENAMLLRTIIWCSNIVDSF